MTKVKANKVLNIDVTSEEKIFDANKKTALNLDYNEYTFTTDGKTLTLTKDEDVITINNASKIKYLKTTSETEFTDIVSQNIIKYTGEYTIRKNKVSGTNYNDTMDFSDENKYTTGLNISVGQGNDTVIGSRHDDIINTKSSTTIHIDLDGNKKFGNDTVNLAKNSNVLIEFKNDLYVENQCVYSYDGKNLKVTAYKKDDVNEVVKISASTTDVSKSIIYTKTVIEQGNETKSQDVNKFYKTTYQWKTQGDEKSWVSNNDTTEYSTDKSDIIYSAKAGSTVVDEESLKTLITDDTPVDNVYKTLTTTYKFTYNPSTKRYTRTFNNVNSFSSTGELGTVITYEIDDKVVTDPEQIKILNKINNTSASGLYRIVDKTVELGSITIKNFNKKTLGTNGKLLIKGDALKSLIYEVVNGIETKDSLYTYNKTSDKYTYYSPFYEIDTSKVKAGGKITGSSFGDTIDVFDNKNISVGKKGVKINGGAGSDVITGSVGNDEISAGTGHNTIIYDVSKGNFGEDTIKTTKNETTTIEFKNDLTNQIKWEVSGKDVKITAYGIEENVVYTAHGTRTLTTGTKCSDAQNITFSKTITTVENVDGELKEISRIFNWTNNNWVEDEDSMTVNSDSVEDIGTFISGSISANYNNEKITSVSLTENTDTLDKILDVEIYKVVEASRTKTWVDGKAQTSTPIESDVVVGYKAYAGTTANFSPLTYTKQEGENEPVTSYAKEYNNATTIKQFQSVSNSVILGTIIIKGLANKGINNGDILLKLASKTDAYSLTDSSSFMNSYENVMIKNKFKGTYLNDIVTLDSDKVKKAVNINAGNGNNVIDISNAVVGNNTIKTGNGNDEITASKYSDTIKAGAGENIIHINNSDVFGNITLSEEKVNAKNIIKFEQNLDDSYIFIQKKNDLIISNDTSTLTIKDYYSTYKKKAEIEFKIGDTVKTLDELMGGKTIITDAKLGTNGNDKFTSTSADENFYIKGGTDTITFGKNFGRDSVFFTSEYDETGAPTNINTMVFSKYSYSKGSVKVGAEMSLSSILNPNIDNSGLHISAGTNAKNGGDVTLEGFLAANNEVKIKDSTGNITRVTVYHKSLDKNWSDDNENHEAFLYGDANEAYTIVSNKNNNTIITDGGAGLNYTYNGGNDKVYTLSVNRESAYLTTTLSDDTYNINSFDKNTLLKIEDHGGKDTMNFKTKSDNLRIYFMVDTYYDSGTNGDIDIIHKDNFDINKLVNYYNGNGSDKGMIRYQGVLYSTKENIRIVDGLENLITTDYTDGLDLISWKKTIVSKVQDWLNSNKSPDSDNTYNSTFEVFNQGTLEQQKELLSLYDISYKETVNTTIGSSNTYIDTLGQSVTGWLSTDTNSISDIIDYTPQNDINIQIFT